MLQLLLLLTLGLIIALAFAIFFTAWMLSHPPRRTYASALAKGRAGDPYELDPPIPFETWALASRGRELPVWDIPGQDPKGPVLIMLHGWGDSRIGSLARIPSLLPCCSRILTLDLPGHGESPGICTLGTHETQDVATMLDTIESDRPIVLLGWSLGAGLAIEFAAQDERVAGVIAEAPYRLAKTPARNVIRAQHMPHTFNLAPAFWILNRLLGDALQPARFDRAKHAADMQCPLLVIHGEHDEVCPIEDGQAIAAAATTGIMQVIEEGDHNSLWTEDQTQALCEQSIQQFIQGLSAE